MANTLTFTPKYKLALQKNYDAFISFARNKLTLFDDMEASGNKGWDCDKWTWHTKRGRKLTIVFGESLNTHNFIPFKQPFRDFAKAYVRYHQSLNHKDSKGWVGFLVFLYKALEEHSKLNNKTSVDLMDINNSIINRTESLIRQADISTSTKRGVAISFETALKFLKEKRIKLDIQEWSNPFPRQSDSAIKLDEDSRDKEEDKCPSDFQMMQVADAFRRAETPRQKYYTSLCVLLMCQPSRIIELGGLTVNSLQPGDKGRWYLMWYPAKGGDPVKKWIPKLIEDVVKQAFSRLVEISAPARAAVKFAYENPDVFMIHDQCITTYDAPQDKPLTYDQFAHAMGFKTGFISKKARVGWSNIGETKWLNNLISNINGVSDWKKELLKSQTISSDNQVVARYSGDPLEIVIKTPSYRDLRQVVDESYKKVGFPSYGDAKIWDCITLIRENEFHKEFAVRQFSWQFVTHSQFRNAMGCKTSEKDSAAGSIFEELDIYDEDGSALYLMSHQFRHWLNTKMKLAGVADWLIAKFSGRADENQNKVYDGRTKEQKARLTKRIGHVGKSADGITVAQVNQLLDRHTSELPPPPLLLHDLGLPVSLKSLGVHRDGVAQFSGIGFCEHNYAESPCLKGGDCSVCSEHVCIKGLPNTLEELKNLKKLLDEQLERSLIKAEERVFGADRWVTATGFRLSKINTIISILEDPEVPDGTLIRVPNELDPSPVKRSLNVDEQQIIPTLDLTALALSDMKE